MSTPVNEVVITEMDGTDGLYELSFSGTAEDVGYDDVTDYLSPEDAYEIAKQVADEAQARIRWVGYQPGWAHNGDIMLFAENS